MKTVLISGGSRGIGKEIVKAFCALGYNVAFTYNNSEDAAREIALSTGALAIKADNKVEKECINAVNTAKEAFGDIDILVNNAGISSFSLFSDLTLDKWNEFLSTNLTGAFIYTKAVLNGMINKKSGRIINISSIWGLVGSSCEVHYSTTKAALIGMTKALAKELGPSGITVNAVAPGVINTEMNKMLTDEDITALKDDTPLCRIGEPSEVAKAVTFLASDDAAFITGEVINVSGGFVIN